MNAILPTDRQTGYRHLANHPGRFDPFNPDPVGALRELLALVQDPVLSTGYRAADYNQTTAMARLALRIAEGRADG